MPAAGTTVRASCAPLAVLLDSYDELVETLRIPPLDRRVYEALFVRPLREYLSALLSGKTPSAPLGALHRDATYGPLLGALQTTLSALRAHERETAHVLRLIDAREDVMMRLIACDEFYQAGKSSIDDAQVTFIVIVEELQVRTLQVVEAIQAWRARLCRPFPFRFHDAADSGDRTPQGRDYLQRIYEDCVAVSQCSLGQSLNLRLDRFPCCSNMDMPRVVRRKQLMRRSKLIGTGAMWQHGLEPAQPEPSTMETERPASTTAATPSGRRPPWADSVNTEEPRSGSAVLWARSRCGAASAHADSAEDPRRAKQKRLTTAEAVILNAARAHENLMDSFWHLAHDPVVADASDTAAESFFVPLLYLPTVLRYACASGSSLPAPVHPAESETRATAKTSARGAPSEKTEAHKRKAQAQARQNGACFPLETAMWTCEARLAREDCVKAATPLTTASSLSLDDGAVVAASRNVPSPAPNKPPRDVSHRDDTPSDEGSTRSRDRRGASASSADASSVSPRSASSWSSRSSSSSAGSAASSSAPHRSEARRRSSHASSHARDSEAYQPYASTSSSGSLVPPHASRATASKPRASAALKKPPVPPSSTSSFSSSSSSSSSSASPLVKPHGVGEYDSPVNRSGDSASEDDHDESSHQKSGRHQTHEESLELLRQQLLEERRLSMSRSVSQSQSQTQNPITSPTRVVAVSPSLPVPQPPQRSPTDSSPAAPAPTATAVADSKKELTSGDAYGSGECDSSFTTESESSD